MFHFELSPCRETKARVVAFSVCRRQKGTLRAGQMSGSCKRKGRKRRNASRTPRGRPGPRPAAAARRRGRPTPGSDARVRERPSVGCGPACPAAGWLFALRRPLSLHTTCVTPVPCPRSPFSVPPVRRRRLSGPQRDAGKAAGSAALDLDSSLRLTLLGVSEQTRASTAAALSA